MPENTNSDKTGRQPMERKTNGQHRFSNRDLARLIIPLFLENLLVLMVGMADTFMSSQAGDAAVSGVSLVNIFGNFFIAVFSAVATGGAVVINQYIGKQDKKGAEHTAGQLLLILTLFSGLCTLLVLVFNQAILNALYGAVDGSVMTVCVDYQRIVALSFFPLGIYNAGSALCRSNRKTNVTLVISIAANVCNIFGNYLSMFVLHAGTVGIAWSTLVSRLISAVAVVIYDFRMEKEIRFRFSELLPFDWTAVKRILRVAVPNTVESGTFQLTKVALSGMLAAFGTVQIAAYGISQSFWSLSALMVAATGPVYVIVIGQCIGAGETQEADYYFRKLTLLTTVAGTLWNVLAYLITPLMMNFYPVSEEVIRDVIRLVLIHNIFNAFIWPVANGLPNGLRAAGDARYTMYVSIASTLVARLAMSWVLATLLGWGVYGITWAMILDWAVRAVIYLIRWRQGKWRQMKLV